MAGRTCPACDSTRLEYSDTDGATVCSDCCAVLEENAIVSSVRPRRVLFLYARSNQPKEIATCSGIGH